MYTIGRRYQALEAITAVEETVVPSYASVSEREDSMNVETSGVKLRAPHAEGSDSYRLTSFIEALAEHMDSARVIQN